MFIVWNNMPWIWLALTVAFIVIESLTFSLTTIWFAIGAFVMIFLSFAPIPGKWQLLIFTLLSCLLLVFTRPIALKKLKKKQVATNSDSLIGKRAELLEPVTELDKGSLKANGIIWSAKSEDGTAIPAGTECVIKSIEGNTLLVQPCPVPQEK